MLTLTVNQCIICLTFLVPLLIWLVSRPMNETINLKDKEQPKQQEHEYNANYDAIMRRQGAYIQSQGRYYN